MKILFFDGYCNLCNNLVDGLIRRDKNNALQFASLQGETAKKHLPGEFILKTDVDTVLYLREGKIYNRSRAVLYALKDVGFPWSVSGVFLILPSFILDWGYKIIASQRYQWFGKKETCRIPTAEEREKILP